LSERISAEAFHEALRRFGIGGLSGVDLPGESRGILPPLHSWAKITSKTVAFGQGVSATYVQVASALAAIANGGLRMKPHVVSAVLDETRSVTERFAPVPSGRALSPEAAEALTKMMEVVVQGEGGTAPMAAIPGYTVAGKTGTAWKPDPLGHGYSRGALICSFMGFVPSRSPRIALLVAVDEPSKGSLYGGTIAAPAFREMARQILAYLQVPPEPGAAVAKAPVGKVPPVPDLEGLNLPPPSVETAEGEMPDVRGLTMREALRRVQTTGVGVRLTLLGSGVAMKQDPGPGAPLAEGKPCRIEFKPLL
jgi:cell division protein FtsI (penicillin-binding protein 3)